MNEQAFELTSMAMRYWFMLLIAIAAICALKLAFVDSKRARKEKLSAPNMEKIGELLVVKGAGEVRRGERFAITRDIVIGRRSKCDICLPDKSVFPRHACGELRSGGMLIGAIGNAPISLKGHPMESEILVCDGALFSIGAYTLQLTLYDVEAEYEVDAAGRAIDARRISGDDYDDAFVPFEHEFDAMNAGERAQDEYGEPALGEYDEPAPDDIGGYELPDYQPDAKPVDVKPARKSAARKPAAPHRR